jgi:hypothetical protein
MGSSVGAEHSMLGEKMDDRVKIGDLVIFKPWDCEGIEMPYGHREHVKLWDPDKQKTKEDFRKKSSITPGATGLVTERVEIDTGYGDKRDSYWCIVEGSRLIVPSHFVNREQEVM